MSDKATVTVRGSGGAVFVIDAPDPGTSKDEWYQARLADGELVVVETAPEPTRRRPAKADEA